MFVLFWNQMTKVFVLRGSTSDGSWQLPGQHDGSSVNWTCIEDGIGGRFDALAKIVEYAKKCGWRNYSIVIENAA